MPGNSVGNGTLGNMSSPPIFLARHTFLDDFSTLQRSSHSVHLAVVKLRWAAAALKSEVHTARTKRRVRTFLFGLLLQLLTPPHV